MEIYNKIKFEFNSFRYLVGYYILPKSAKEALIIGVEEQIKTFKPLIDIFRVLEIVLNNPNISEDEIDILMEDKMVK